MAIEWRKVFTGLAIALLGAGATWLEQDFLKLVDFGGYIEVAVAVNSAIVNLIRKVIQAI